MCAVLDTHRVAMLPKNAYKKTMKCYFNEETNGATKKQLRSIL